MNILEKRRIRKDILHSRIVRRVITNKGLVLNVRLDDYGFPVSDKEYLLAKKVIKGF